MISAVELEAMRQTVVDQALPDLADIQRPSKAADGVGGRTTTWDTIEEGVACRLSHPTGGTPGSTTLGQLIAERLGNRVLFVASLAAETDVQDGDRLVVSGRTYEILRVVNGSWEIARRAMVAEVA